MKLRSGRVIVGIGVSAVAPRTYPRAPQSRWRGCINMTISLAVLAAVSYTVLTRIMHIELAIAV